MYGRSWVSLASLWSRVFTLLCHHSTDWVHLPDFSKLLCWEWLSFNWILFVGTIQLSRRQIVVIWMISINWGILIHYQAYCLILDLICCDAIVLIVLLLLLHVTTPVLLWPITSYWRNLWNRTLIDSIIDLDVLLLDRRLLNSWIVYWDLSKTPLIHECSISCLCRVNWFLLNLLNSLTWLLHHTLLMLWMTKIVEWVLYIHLAVIGVTSIHHRHAFVSIRVRIGLHHTTLVLISFIKSWIPSAILRVHATWNDLTIVRQGFRSALRVVLLVIRLWIRVLSRIPVVKVWLLNLNSWWRQAAWFFLTLLVFLLMACTLRPPALTSSVWILSVDRIRPSRARVDVDVMNLHLLLLSYFLLLLWCRLKLTRLLNRGLR